VGGEPDITLDELRVALAGIGLSVANSTLRRFFACHAIMDNLSGHKRASVLAMIEDAGASLRFLPPCSPGFNPGEKAFSRLKAMLRKAGARTVSGFWDLMGQLVDLCEPAECANCFSSCRYDPD